MTFDWNETKAAANQRKHGVTFDEAASVFLDSLAISGPDPDHSTGETRYVTFGMSGLGRLCSSWHTPTAPVASESSVRGVSVAPKGNSMKKAEDELRVAYKRSDFTKLERGKFHKEVAKGTSVVLLDPKLAKSFPTSESVNEALRGLLMLTEQTSRITGRATGRITRRRAA